jgi:hypothetical protein
MLLEPLIAIMPSVNWKKEGLIVRKTIMGVFDLGEGDLI